VRLLLPVDGRAGSCGGKTPTLVFPLSIKTSLCQSCGMLAKVYSAAVYGVDAYEVEIEVNASTGNPVIVIVG
jgi:hypothetical protein